MNSISWQSPSGDPALIRSMGHHLSRASEGMAGTASELSASDSETASVWTGKSQQVFSLLTETIQRLIAGSSAIGLEFGQALVRYAETLERCQEEARLARTRFEALSSSPTADPAVILSILSQARAAIAEAEAAARSLSAKALELMGSPGNTAALHSAADENSASFVSQAHALTWTGGTGPDGAFDATAALVSHQLDSVLNSLVPQSNRSVVILPPGRTPHAGSAIGIAFPPAFSTVSGSIMLKPGVGTGGGTLLLGPTAPLANPPAIAVLAPGMGPAPTNIAILPPVRDLTTEYLLSDTPDWVKEEIAEYEAYLNSPEYEQNFNNTMDGGINQSIAESTVIHGMGRIQDMTEARWDAHRETWAGVDYDYSGDIGDVQF